jgi:hypothetical protein
MAGRRQNFVHYNIHLRNIFLVKITVPGPKKEISGCAGIYAHVPPPEREKREQKYGTALKQNGGALNAKLCNRVYSIKYDAFLQLDTSSHSLLHIRRQNALLY